MNWFFDLISNQFFIVGLSSWALAQVLKTIIHAAIYKKLEWERLFGDGGMPSGHSATVTSLATMSALVFGLGGFEFAIAATLAIIVCHDAMGVRRETGKQATIIIEMMELLEVLTKKDLPETKLKEFVGHTPLQVIAGSIIGIGNACFMYFVIFS
ncbi:MAG: divergent PAP2 family protein [Lachnospiraceae bacterium]|nr:divergent PAP2 family protein [Lachnospiraceae bacterium]